MPKMMIIYPVIIITLITTMSLTLKKKKLNKTNKSPFECGFSKMMNPKEMPFSIQFFILSTMFIIFDVEISILMTMIIPMSQWKITEWAKPSLIFLSMMVMGIMYEWKESAMYWTK